jgi:DNA-binding NarL/FixJ family response regulator
LSRREARLLVVSSVRLLRDGLVTILGQREGIEAAHPVADVDLALDALESFQPTLILVDVSSRDNLQAARRLASEAAGIPLLGFAAREEEHDMLAYAQTGLTGFVLREASVDELFDAIDRAVHGEFLCPPRLAAALFRQLAALAGISRADSDPLSLTGREREIVRFIDEGWSNKEIARHLSIELSTVKNHVHNILEKLQVTRRGEAAARVRNLRSS